MLGWLTVERESEGAAGEEREGGTARQAETKERLEIVPLWSVTSGLPSQVLSFHVRANSRRFREKA